MPKRDITIPTPPFWGRREIKLTQQQIEMAFEWINHKILFKSRWGYSSKGMKKEEYQKQLDEVVWPAYERLKKQFIEQKLFDPTIIYGYWPCRSDDNELLIFDESEGYFSEKDRNNQSLEEVKENCCRKVLLSKAEKTATPCSQ